MEFLSSQGPLVTLIAGLVAGFLLGVGCMMLLDRRRAGGKSVDQLRKEFDDYRDKVAVHFSATSDLFRDMTEKYRDVYNHLASGSQALCEDPMQHARLEFSDQENLTHDDADAEQLRGSTAQGATAVENKAV